VEADDHQVHIEGLGRRTTNGPDHCGSERDLRHETAINDVQVNSVGAGAIDGRHFYGEVTKSAERTDGAIRRGRIIAAPQAG
jgi:hypothetical protein